MAGRREAGFSLIELLILVVVGTTLAGMAVPPVRESISHYQLSAAAYMLRDELEAARMLALSRAARYSLVVNVQERTFQVVDPGDPGNPPRSLKTLPAGTLFKSWPGEAISFYPRGNAVAGAIELVNGYGEVLRISVSPSGIITIEKVEGYP